MNLSEIAIAFKDCNAETNTYTFKDYKERLKSQGTDFKGGLVVNDVNNFILYDCEKLLTKSILNIVATDLLMKKGLFNWSFISSYYSSFFSIQALNRLQLNFTAYDVKCEVVNYNTKEVKLTRHSSSSNSHDEQFHIYQNNNVPEYKKEQIDRIWNLGLSTFEGLEGYGSEHRLRNAINYYLSHTDKFYYELNIPNSDFQKIIKDNCRSPFLGEKDLLPIPPNFAKRALKIATARIRVVSYVLNYIANHNAEYKSYYIRNMNNRIDPLKIRYPFISDWLLAYLADWLKFNEIPVEEIFPLKV